MDKPTFSIIIPTHNRLPLLKRAVRSLLSQTYDKHLFEILIVDDGSTDGTGQTNFDEETDGPKITVYSFSENQGRIAARIKGMELATKDWICWLDSDDEYVSTYLEVFARAIEQHPETSIFTCGTLVLDEKTVQSGLRDPFMPDLRPDGRGCLPFKSGRVSTGGFIFKRGLGAKLDIPGQTRVPYGGADSFPAVTTQKYPELAALYGQNSDGQWLPFGNPWGDDWLAFYLLTRENIPIKLNIHLYIQHMRHG